ncbi:MAG: hypothetical protein AMXMBFR36_14200 [Acidobacteriota bacterium]
MRPIGIRGLLTAGSLALVAVAAAATAALAWQQVGRLAEEEGLARAERALERAADAVERGLDPRLFEEGTEVRIELRSRPEVEAAAGDARIPLWRRALEDGSARAVLPGGHGAVAVRRLGDGRLIETSLSRAALGAPLRRLGSRLALASALVAALAAVAAALAARRIGRPLEQLAGAAERLGRGDLAWPVPETGGAEIGALAASLETMRRRLGQARGELERRRAELEAIVAGIAEGVIAVDADRRIRFASPPAASFLGASPEELVGGFCGDALRPEAPGGVRPCDDACPIVHARSLGRARAVEQLAPRGGACRPWVVSASAPTDGLQVVILREETSVESAARARDAAVADLAHELSTPLAAQSASLELLRDRLEDSDRAALDLVLALEAGTSRLARLIENLLESVRIESGQLAIRRAPIHVDELVESAVALTRPLLERRGQRLDLRLAEPLPGLTGDGTRLVQVLVNLLANASKFGPEGSEITLSAAAGADGQLELAIEDDGPGPPAGVGASPGRFRRGSSEPREDGSGLGLWISRSILERHGGELKLSRTGSRTRAVARLPAESAP